MTVPDLSATRLALLESLFDEALSVPLTSRDTFISERTSHDPSLGDELRALLAAHAQTGAAFDIPLAALRDIAERYVGTRLGAYEIGRQIGAGGMGTVHEAVRADDQYRARVAVKFLRHSAETPQAIRRFRDERQILASLQHPHIATLLDGGVTAEGLPYFVMEYIDGEPITHWCDTRQLDVTRRLQLFLQVCSAVRAAHQRLVVHRDLKPGNILVNADGEVKLLDFGIAKLMREDDGAPSSTATQAGQRAFTPEYAAPEQLRGEPVDTTADIYALGVVLFELLAGTRPFALQDRTPAEMERIVSEQPAPRPSNVLTDARVASLGERSVVRAQRRLAGDLDAIVQMALRKERERRYPTVDALARDVERYLAQLPVQAQPDGLGYRIRKLVRRRKLEVAAGTIAVLSLLGGTWAALRQAREAERARDVATREQGRAEEVTRFLMTMLNSSNPESFGKDVTMRTVLDSAAMRADSLRVSPELEAEIRAVMGNAYLALGELDLAEKQFTLDMAARHRHAPTGDYETAVTFSKLALVEETRGNFGAADSLLQHAERLYQQFPHVDRREEAIAVENRGRLLYQLGKVDAALAQFRKSLALSERYFPTEDSSNAPTYINAAVVFADAGNAIAADTFSLRGMQAAKRAHGTNHPVMANALSVRANVLELLHRLPAADSAYRETLAVKERLLGADHISYNVSAVNYADFLARSERWRDVNRIAVGVLTHRGTSLDDTSYPVQLSLILRGRALAHLDSLSTAEALVREGRRLRAQSVPPDHWILASTDGALAEVFMLGGRYAEAERLLLSAESRIRAARGLTATPTNDQRRRLVTLYTRWGKPDQASAWQQRLSAQSE